MPVPARLTHVALVAIVFTTGCRETFARVVGAGVISWGGGCGSEPMLAVGDSMQFQARVERRKRGDLSFNPLDGWTLYTTESNPGAFDWEIRLQRDEPLAGLEGRGGARITTTGVLIGESPGYVDVWAKSAGAANFSRYLVVPRVRRMSVTPLDTVILPGDTMTARLDVELETAWNGKYVIWNVIGQGSGTESVASAYHADSDRSRVQRFVGLRSGTGLVEVCVAGTRRDTMRLEVKGR